jgi:hypothetical protein
VVLIPVLTPSVDRFVNRCPDHHILGMKNLELSDEQAAALEKELRRIIDDDRYPLSPRIQMLRKRNPIPTLRGLTMR